MSGKFYLRSKADFIYSGTASSPSSFSRFLPFLSLAGPPDVSVSRISAVGTAAAASNFANFLKLGNFRGVGAAGGGGGEEGRREGYSILLIHFREFKHPLAFNRSTT